MLPRKRAANGIVPAGEQALALGRCEIWAEAPIERPALGELVGRGIDARLQTGQVCGPQRRRLQHRRPIDRGIDDVGLIFVSSSAQLTESHWWVVVLDNSDQAGALGYHDLTSAGLPISKVFAGTDKQYGKTGR